MVERQVPDREGLVLRIPRAHAAPQLVVQLRQAGRHLAAARAGGGHDDELPRRFNIIVLAVPFLAHDARDIGRVFGDGVVMIHRDAKLF